jgi:hypothetical protein
MVLGEVKTFLQPDALFLQSVLELYSCSEGERGGRVCEEEQPIELMREDWGGGQY